MNLRVFTDASLSKFVIGVGVRVTSTEGIRFDLEVPVKPGITSTEAELYALLIGIDVVKSVLHCHKIKKQADITFLTDCEPALRSVFGFSTPRSQSTRALAKRVAKALDKAKRTHFKSWKLQPIKSASNQADRLARAARDRWKSIWKIKENGKSSGPSQ